MSWQPLEKANMLRLAYCVRSSWLLDRIQTGHALETSWEVSMRCAGHRFAGWAKTIHPCRNKTFYYVSAGLLWSCFLVKSMCTNTPVLTTSKNHCFWKKTAFSLDAFCHSTLARVA